MMSEEGVHDTSCWFRPATITSVEFCYGNDEVQTNTDGLEA